MEKVNKHARWIELVKIMNVFLYFRSVMNKVKNIHELSQLSEKRLQEILGNAGNAKILWNFFHDNHKLDANKKWLIRNTCMGMEMTRLPVWVFGRNNNEHGKIVVKYRSVKK